MTARRAAVPRLLAVPALAVLLAGCGIRATEVPTNFGPAPSRVQCSLAEPDVSTQAARGLPVQVFLLCGSSLVTVDRTVRVPDGAADSERRILVAQGLLDQLAAPPSAAAESETVQSTCARAYEVRPAGVVLSRSVSSGSPGRGPPTVMPPRTSVL